MQAYTIELGSASRSIVSGQAGVWRAWTGEHDLIYGGFTYTAKKLIMIGKMRLNSGLRIPTAIPFEIAVPRSQNPGAAIGRIQMLEDTGNGWNQRWLYAGMVSRLVQQNGVTVGELKHLIWWLHENTSAERWDHQAQLKRHHEDMGWQYAAQLATGGYKGMGIYYPPK